MTVAHPLLVLLLPLGIAGVIHRGRFALLVCTPLLIFLILYSMYTIFLSNYALPIAPAMIVLILSAAAELKKNYPRVRTLVLPVILGLTLSTLPEITHAKDDPALRLTARACAAFPDKVKVPAVVFFRYRPGCSVHDEPVYNLSSASPDDCPVVRAQDLGAARDRDLIQYYAEKQPDRHVYLFDRGDNSLRYLGPVNLLAKQLHTDQ